MDTLDLLLNYLPKFMVILLRTGVFLSLMPFFGSKSFPGRFKLGFVLAMSLVLTPVVELEVSRTAMPVIVLREIVIGVALGLTARFVFFVADMAGQIMSTAMGLSIATAFNPEIGESTEVARFYGIVAMLVFLSMDAHHDLIYVFVKSYEWLPIGQLSLKKIVPEMISVGSRLFTMALKIGAPVIVVMVITNLVLTFLYKAAPQMNIFFIGYPVYIFVGFLVILIGIPVFVQVAGGQFSVVKDDMMRVLSMVRG